MDSSRCGVNPKEKKMARVALFFLGLLGCPFVLHWGMQYRHRLMQCEERHYVNHELLSHQVCADPHIRQRFGEKIDCQRAESEVSMGRYLCAWHLWKEEDFGPYGWFRTLFNSNWLYLIILAAILMAIWAYFQTRRDLAMQRQHMEWCSQSFNAIMDTTPPAQKTIGWKNKGGRRVPSARRASLRQPRRFRPRRHRRLSSSTESSSCSVD